MGGFNLHFLRHEQHTITGEFVERVFSPACFTQDHKAHPYNI